VQFIALDHLNCGLQPLHPAVREELAGVAARQYRSLIDNGVESGSELVKHLAQLKSEVIFGEPLERDDFDDASCPVAIHLYGDSGLTKAFH
jgi:hypothetical protein